MGASTRLPGRRFREHADDLAQVLDHLGLERVHLVGGSGAAPHELALCQYHPERVVAATVVAGMAPLEEDEIDTMIPLNAQVFRLARDGRRDEVAAVLGPHRDAILADPLGAFEGIMGSCSPGGPRGHRPTRMWRQSFRRSLLEALGAGLDGWVDEALALDGTWDVDPAEVPTSVTWYHAVEDRNCPVAAARRLVGRLPAGRLVEWTNAGHLTAYHLEGEILDELLARG